MLNLSSPPDQVSTFIVNNVYFGKTFKFRLNRNVMATKLSKSSITPSLKAVLTK